jgi:DNA-binding XRE family transcriptional regulator
MLNKGLEGATPKEVKEIESELQSIGSAIQTYRQKAKISQEKLAEILDVNVNTIKYIEQGRRLPSLPMLIRICSKINLKLQLLPKK